MKKNHNARYFFAEPSDGKNPAMESFARFTVNNRFPKIFSEHCSGDYFEDFLKKPVLEMLGLENDGASNSSGYFSAKTLADFLKSVNAKINEERRKRQSDDSLTEANTLEDFFNNAPFFESEILFYHVLLAQKGYFSNRYDFFATEKKNSLESDREKFIDNLNHLFASNSQKHLDKQSFNQCVKYCLSANTSDLSQLNAKERFGYRLDDIQILHDDTDVLFQYLLEKKDLKRVDIICDNAGKELFSDLYLACYFLHNNITDKVVFHLKPYPFFVSDATKEDFGFMMNAVMQYGSPECTAQCGDYIRSGKIEIEDDAFWAAPLCFKDMPHGRLYKELCSSGLIVVKGDLNYRRLVEDRAWHHTDSFSVRTDGVFKKTPIFAPRVLKSDVLIGISEATYQTAKSSDKHNVPADQRFKGNGKWGVIHFRSPAFGRQQKASQKKNYGQVRHDDVPRQSDEKETYCSPGGRQKYLCKEDYYLTILVLLIVMIFCVIGAICYSFFCGNFSESPKDHLDFSVILAGITTFVAASILLPKLLLEKEVKNEVQSYADAKVRERTDECIGAQIKGVKNELSRMDAHLSRMIAFQLNKQYPVWSVGWAYRSLKRYKELDSKKIGLDKYSDFIDFLRFGVIEPAEQKFHENIRKKYPYESAVDVFLYLISAHDVLLEEAESVHEKGFRPCIRAVKDITDFEFAVRFDESLCLSETEKDILMDIVKCAGNFALELCAAMLIKPKNDANSLMQTNSYDEKRLTRELLAISNYGNEGSVKMEIRQKFRQMLKKTLEKISLLEKDEGKYYKTKKNSDNDFFFPDEGETFLLIKE